MQEIIRRINAEFGLELSEEEIRTIALQAEAMNHTLKPLLDVDVTKAMPIIKLDRRMEK